MSTKLKEFIEIGRANGTFNSGKGYVKFCKHQLFPNENFESKSVLEIGAGNGIYSIWTVLQGASDVIALEPSAEGSTNVAVEKFKEFLSPLNLVDKIKISEITFQNFYKGDLNKFDYIILINSINHLNEEMCIKLNKDAVSREYYVNLFKQMYWLLNPNGKLIITDCSNTSFYTFFGITNPFARSIEWFKHQPPEIWINLLKDAGFKNPKVDWTYHPRLPRGIFNNRIAANFYNNLFRLEVIKKNSI